MCSHVDPSIAVRACRALCGLAFAGKRDDFVQLDEVRCIAEALLYTHSGTLDAASFKVSVFCTLLINILYIADPLFQGADEHLCEPGQSQYIG